MPEQSADKTIFSLLEVTTSIKKTLTERYQSAFWIKAEMNKLNLHPPSGHCYPDLVEKKDGRIVAEIGANLWAADYERINRLFLQLLNEPLKSGIHILLLARITYDPQYGLRLRIVDIDPGFSLGQLEKEKLATIGRLRQEGIYDRNRSLRLPLLPKRIAIISVQTSKGYSDFQQILEQNPWQYRFFLPLFPAVLQGDRAVETITRQLRNIWKIRQHFDAVAIIRGGGGDVGLTCYNDYNLCREIALFPLPVLTGIGHSTNETVAEKIAFRNSITPTDLADYLIQQFHNFAVPVSQARERLADLSRRILKEERQQLFHAGRYFRSVTGSLLARRSRELQLAFRDVQRQSTGACRSGLHQLALARTRLAGQTAVFLSSTGKELAYQEKSIGWLNPDNVLKRGYTITLVDGVLAQGITQIKEGQNLKTIFTDGTVTTSVGPSSTIEIYPHP
jgi:exodeoxyribonuclease VII large subunit